MGQFSWLDCKNSRKQIFCNEIADVYLLIPAEFGGGHYHETCYDGYGNFDCVDVYEAVALWNRKYLNADSIECPKPEQYCSEEYYALAVERYNKKVNRLIDFVTGKKTDDEMADLYGDDYLREIGIDVACYDEQNFALKYPIKITHDAAAVYEKCKPSKSDPNQGWK